MNKEFLDAIEANPIIAAVKDEQGLQNCLGREELTVIFILYGDIRSIGGIVERIHQAGKIAMAHIDLITGLSSKEVSVDYICKNIHTFLKLYFFYKYNRASVHNRQFITVYFH